jgi:LytS/YehU family sensor histidine kinase
VLLALLMWIVYMAWSLGYFWVKAELAAHREALDATRARGEAQRIELQLLRAQLDPHFLFNSLNGIASEIRPNPEVATGMVRELADYLRYSLEHRDCLVTALSVELDAAAAYLRIEKTRFGDRLETEISADAAARAVKVPSFLLQPIVENAVKHGFSSVEPPWRLSISARAAEGGLDLAIQNSGLPDGVHHGTGLGLDTIRRRLALHYPGRHRFDIAGGNGMVTVTIHLEGEPCCV